MEESKIIGLLRIRKDYTRYGSLVKPSYFTSDAASRLYEYIQEFFEKYPDKEMISLKNLRQLVKEKGDDRKVILKMIPRCKAKGLDPGIIGDGIKAFIQHGIIKDSLMENLGAIEGRCDFDIEGMRQALEQAEELDISEEVYNYVEETEAMHFDEDRIAGEPLATGVYELDRILPWAPTKRELWVVLAPPGRGKTQWMLNMLCHAGSLGYCGLYITCGDQGQVDIRLRMDTIISDIPYYRLLDPSQSSMGLLAKRVKKRIIKPGGNLLIKDWSDTSCTPGQVENLIQSIDPFPDIVAVDYPDIMRPGRQHRYSEKRHEIGSIVGELRRIARRTNVLMWVGSQANREALSRKNVRLENMAEDISKAWTADGIVGYCQTDEEKEEGLGRAFLAKARRPGIKVLSANFDIDYDTGRIK